MQTSMDSQVNTYIVACVDGSVYTTSVGAHAAWVAGQLDAPVRLLFVQPPGSDYHAPTDDLSGALGLGAKSSLLEQLTQVDEARGKLEQQRGRLILDHVREQVQATGVNQVETLHRRGSLVETLTDLDESTRLVVVGKRGESADFAKLHLGSNLERVVRAARHPVLVAAREFRPIQRFVVAYDGGSSTRKAVEFLIAQPLLEGLDCHLLKIGPANRKNQEEVDTVADRLRGAGYSVRALLKQGQVDEAISDYVKQEEMDLLIMGAYGHSHFRSLFLGSTTSSMLRSCLIPVLMFR